MRRFSLIRTIEPSLIFRSIEEFEKGLSNQFCPSLPNISGSTLSSYPNAHTFTALAFVANKMLDYTGKSWGIDLHDQPSGDLTCNIGVVRMVDGCLKISVDIRFPVTYTCDQMHDLLKKQTPFAVVPDHISEPLFVPSDSFLVETLLACYDDAMGGKSEPLAIGGGTYSRCLPNCVAFGPLFPDEEQTIHMPNEVISLENLKKMTLIYLDAITRLSK